VRKYLLDCSHCFRTTVALARVLIELVKLARDIRNPARITTPTVRQDKWSHTLAVCNSLGRAGSSRLETMTQPRPEPRSLHGLLVAILTCSVSWMLAYVLPVA
jgi:hypothetical protein